MDRAFWLQRWETGELSWHRDAVNDLLVAHAGWLLDGGPHRVLVPLCGKSVDLGWLADQGHEVVGVELSPIAARAVFGDDPPEPEPHGPFHRFRRGRVTVLCGDLFEATPDRVGPVDRVWDRAAMVALAPDQRGPYVQRLRALLGEAGRVLLVGYTYDGDKSGPPHSVPEAEVRAHYGGATVDVAETHDISDQIRDTWRDVGMTRLAQTVYRITLGR